MQSDVCDFYFYYLLCSALEWDLDQKHLFSDKRYSTAYWNLSVSCSVSNLSLEYRSLGLFCLVQLKETPEIWRLRLDDTPSARGGIFILGRQN